MKNLSITTKEALNFHKLNGIPGKVSLLPTKPLLTQRDLSLAYSPGVAEPCKAIHNNPINAYDYTAKGNYVAVISNGTAVLGLGNLGPLASKPVMEGKAVLFKKFAGVDAIDIEVDTEDPDEFVFAVKLIAQSWGGINLEDISAPNCFIIEEKLREILDIPVFHDDQHGTAIVCAAGLINALDITNKEIDKVKVVLNGPGAAGLACVNLLKSMGLQNENLLMCDRQGVVHSGRKDEVDKYKAEHIIETDARTLADAMKGADVFLGLSAKDALKPEMLETMNENPIIFAMANPDPEIDPKLARKVRPDAIIATGRSDYPNQVNNVSGFPYIFRGALDVRAKTINEEMKIAAANALAMLAREPIPDQVASAYSGRTMQYGKEYIIPTPFDPRLITRVASAVAEAAIKSGVARKPIKDIEQYKDNLISHFNPINNTLSRLYTNIKNHPKTVIFAEGEEDNSILCANQWLLNEYGNPILVGREKIILNKMDKLGISPEGIAIENSAISEERNTHFINYMYNKLQRKGLLLRDCVREVKTDRNIFASCMLMNGMADIMITGLTRSFSDTLQHASLLVKPNAIDTTLFGFLIAVIGDKTLFIADAAVHESPSSDQLANISIKLSKIVASMGFIPKVAFVSYGDFGNPKTSASQTIRGAMDILYDKKVNFQYDGEMSVSVALNPELRKIYPFCKLDGDANILITPDLHSANISLQLLHEMSDCHIIGPIMVGFEKPVQIMHLDSTTQDILNAAVCAAEVNS